MLTILLFIMGLFMGAYAGYKVREAGGEIESYDRWMKYEHEIITPLETHNKTIPKEWNG